MENTEGMMYQDEQERQRNDKAIACKSTGKAGKRMSGKENGIGLKEILLHPGRGQKPTFSPGYPEGNPGEKEVNFDDLATNNTKIKA